MVQRSLNPRGIATQPTSDIYWIHRNQITGNDYNPNSVAPPEMDLLKYSIMRIGWVFPILLMDNGAAIPYSEREGQRIVSAATTFTIIDGFHRFTISADPDVYAMTDGLVPVVFIPADDVMQYTVMMNRAKGVHNVLSMSNIVTTLLQQGRTVEQIKSGMGMSEDEIVRLANGAGITREKAFRGIGFSNSWTPKT